MAFLIPLPNACKAYAIPIIAGGLFYPLSKRISNYPQIILALVLPSSVFMGAAAVGQKPFAFPSSFSPPNLLDISTWTPADKENTSSLMFIYFLLILWTLIYELIYSFQDAAWDADAGIGTMTILFASTSSAKKALGVLAILQSLSYQYVGSMFGADTALRLVASMLVTSSLAIQIFCVNLADEKSCMYWFVTGKISTGLAMLFGLVIEYIRRMISG